MSTDTPERNMQGLGYWSGRKYIGIGHTCILALVVHFKYATSYPTAAPWTSIPDMTIYRADLIGCCSFKFMLIYSAFID